jgi:hypothetical protein
MADWLARMEECAHLRRKVTAAIGAGTPCFERKALGGSITPEEKAREHAA